MNTNLIGKPVSFTIADMNGVTTESEGVVVARWAGRSGVEYVNIRQHGTMSPFTRRADRVKPL